MYRDVMEDNERSVKNHWAHILALLGMPAAKE